MLPIYTIYIYIYIYTHHIPLLHVLPFQPGAHVLFEHVPLKRSQVEVRQWHSVMQFEPNDPGRHAM